MSKLFARLSGLFKSRNLVGVDKSGNRYFTRKEELDGIMKEKRWVIFKEEEDPTSIPVEWICWLNGQRKKAPTHEEMAELEARRESVKLNVALLKKEEEERKSKEGLTRRSVSTGKVGGPDLKSFIRQFPSASIEGPGHKEEPTSVDGSTDGFRHSKETGKEKIIPPRTEQQQPESSEPTGSGKSFKPGMWQPPT